MVIKKLDEISLDNMSSFKCQEHLIHLRSSLGMDLGKVMLNQNRRIIQKIENRLGSLIIPDKAGQ